MGSTMNKINLVLVLGRVIDLKQDFLEGAATLKLRFVTDYPLSSVEKRTQLPRKERKNENPVI